MKTLIGIVTFGNAQFTKLAVESVLETSPLTNRDIVLIIGKPGDGDNASYAASMQIPHITHGENKGFPASINDIYDFAWKANNYDNLIIMGNDVIAYPYAINSLINVAEKTKHEWICSREYKVKDLCNKYPEARESFSGDKYIINDFSRKPWNLALGEMSKDICIDAAGLSDVHNMALFKKSVFDKIGYIDVNFYPAYYEDNDYVRRAIKAKIDSCTIGNSIYFHFWSRTIHQGKDGSTSKQFDNNKFFYMAKWGGDFLSERFDEPFGGKSYTLANGLVLPPMLNIRDRDLEPHIINYWRGKG